MAIVAIVEGVLKTGVLPAEQEAATDDALRYGSCTEADLSALEVLLNKLVSCEVRYVFSDRAGRQ